jgi:hypothetical protein
VEEERHDYQSESKNLFLLQQKHYQTEHGQIDGNLLTSLERVPEVPHAEEEDNSRVEYPCLGEDEVYRDVGQQGDYEPEHFVITCHGMDYPHIDILKMRNETYLAEDTVDNVLVADIVAGKLGIDAQKHHAQDEQPTQRDRLFIMYHPFSRARRRKGRQRKKYIRHPAYKSNGVVIYFREY